MLERAVDLGKVNLAEDDPDVLVTALHLARAHLRAGDAGAARRVLEESYAAGQWRLGDHDPLIVEISAEIGTVAEELGNRHEARKAFTRVAEFGPAALGANHQAVTRARTYLGTGADTPAEAPAAPRRAAEPPAQSVVNGLTTVPPATPISSPPGTTSPQPSASPVSGSPISGSPVSGAPISGVPSSGAPVSGVPGGSASALHGGAAGSPAEERTTLFGAVPSPRAGDEAATTMFGAVPAAPDEARTTMFGAVPGADGPHEERTTMFGAVPAGDHGTVAPPPAATPVWTPPGQDGSASRSPSQPHTGQPHPVRPNVAQPNAVHPQSAQPHPGQSYAAQPHPAQPHTAYPQVPAQHPGPEAWPQSPYNAPQLPAQDPYARSSAPISGAQPGTQQDAYGRKGLGLFAAIAAILAAVIAVVALVYVVANKTSQSSEPATVSTTPTSSGVPPMNVKLTDEGAEIQVTWTDPTQGTVSFIVSMGHPGQLLQAAGKFGPGQTSYRARGLNPNLQYCFVVSAVYTADKIANADPVCTTRGSSSPAK